MTEDATPWTWSQQPAADEATLLLVGDTNIQGRGDPAEAFKRVGATLNAADVLFGQLEGPLSPPSEDPENPDIAHKLLWRHSDPRMVEGYKAAGFKAFACASNVCYPPRAALTSNATLDAAGIAHCGAGANLAEARKPAIVESKGVRFGFLSYTSVFWHVNHAATPESAGCATIKIHTGYQPGRRALEMPGTPPLILTVPDSEELAAMEEDIRKLREDVDVVVMSCHWGISSSTEIADYQQTVGRAAIDAGADVVFGHHPHVVQGAELYKGKPVFYSLGNFAFDWVRMQGRNLDGIMIRLIASKAGVRDISVLPVRRNDDNLVGIADPAQPEGADILRQLEERSAPFGTAVERRGADAALVRRSSAKAA
ncbi:CapA family protein [Pelagibius sp.]|uniref:CapA family protein n=1 Tax=Pelagibius sp. TaxID=1931238 RepID=UPI002615D9D1|nr:CapA family protein [Pelagibius sp.]